MDEEKRHGDRAEGAKNGGKSDVWVTVIGVGKLIKVALLTAVGIAALVAVNHDPPEMLEHAANFVGVDHDSHHLQRLVAKLAGVTTKKLEAVGFGSFVYAALFATEGVGLLLKKRWAEYLTIVITISFLPLEIYELVHHSSVAKVVTLVLNALVAIYLIVRVTSSKTSARAARHRFALSSTPTASRPIAFATASTVPLPQNGSTTTRDSTSSRR
jgi:uncharacterized membrane protein (DUF2068 family)